MKQSKAPLVVIAVGGTGGHLYPAQILAQELLQKCPEMNIVFLGHELSKNRFFNHDRFEYEDIPSATCSLKKIWTFPKACIRIAYGIMHSLKFFRRHEPALVVGFGSFHALPILAASYLSKVTYVLFEANAILGKVNKLFSGKAYLTTYQLFDLKEKSKPSFIKTLLPMKEEQLQKIPQTEARRYFGLKSSITTLLVFGGSQGATSLNQLVLKALKRCQEEGCQFQVIHLIGFNMDLAAIQMFYERHGIRASVKIHETQMHYAYSAADILLSRAGANTVAEQLYHQIPAIFIPYPYLADDHQTFNARYVCDELQGGVVVSQKGLTEEALAIHIKKFLQRECYQKKKEALQSFGREESKKLSDVVLEILR